MNWAPVAAFFGIGLSVGLIVGWVVARCTLREAYGSILADFVESLSDEGVANNTIRQAWKLTEEHLAPRGGCIQ